MKCVKSSIESYFNDKMSQSDKYNDLFAVIKTYPVVLYPTDLLEKTALPGIVLRLSSFTITKALIRLDSLSSAGSVGLLVLLSMQTVWFFEISVAGRLLRASWFFTWIYSKRLNLGRFKLKCD